MNLRFHPAALAEFEKSIRWYKKRSSNAALKFQAEVLFLCQRIVETPQHFPVIAGDRRNALLKRFPYSIVFESIDDTFYVLAVAHAKRRRGYWRNRQHEL